MYMSRQWREEHLQQDLRIWGPRIGEQATHSRARGRWTGQVMVFLLLGYIASTSAWQLVAHKHAGAPMAMPAIVFWPVILYVAIRGVRLSLRSLREAGKVVGNSDKARPAIKNIDQFERWVKTSKYSRYKNQVPPWES